jgi:hypothetical protein
VSRGAALALALAAVAAAPALAEKTVCTITVNSEDEREVFKQQLPTGKYRFVELVERGRPDWLARACREQVRCDVLLVSGHFAGTDFYSSKPDTEYLPVDEMERVPCSDACPGLFSGLQEIYLFGCDTLKAEPVKSATPEIVRGLVRAGRTRAEAERLAKALSERHGESSRGRMRRIFANVPVIYGFSSLAPYGRVAGPMLRRHFEAGPDAEVGSGRVSARLLATFAPASMVVTHGLRSDETDADFRAEVCSFYDDRLTVAQKVAHIHRLLARDMAEVRMSFDRVEKFVGSLRGESRAEAAAAVALAALRDDSATRERYLGLARDTEDPALRVRMIDLARSLEWLDAAGQRAEVMRMVSGLLAGGSPGFSEVDLVCGLNRTGELDAELHRVSSMPVRHVAESALLACLGSAANRDLVLRALASPNEHEVQVAEAYVRHRPITDGAELRTLAAGVTRMAGAAAQVRALAALARQHVSDREVLDELARLYARTKSAGVQQAIAEVFIRASGEAMSMPGLAAVFRQHRLKPAHGGSDLVEVLLKRLAS